MIIIILHCWLLYFAFSAPVSLHWSQCLHSIYGYSTLQLPSSAAIWCLESVTAQFLISAHWVGSVTFPWRPPNYNSWATFAKKTAAMDLTTGSQELTLLTSGNSYWSGTVSHGQCPMGGSAVWMCLCRTLSTCIATLHWLLYLQL